MASKTVSMKSLVRHPSTGEVLSVKEAVTAWGLTPITRERHSETDSSAYVTEYRLLFPSDPNSIRISEYAYKSLTKGF